ncbi:MAG: hypothetical protein L6R38_007327 [Xanthoria sp. 2 TBL-2021]|nr:MAG: hypothetical protein L6R38_007327 [Xanthoria sp. 2 TBL-2021]
MSTRLFKLVFTVPHSSLEVCKQAVFSAGAGTFPGGKYSEVCFETQGTGQYIPGAGAKPAIGEVGKVEKVEETKVEVQCVGKEVVVAAVDKLKRAHPYEEVAYEVYAMEDV